MAAGVYDLKARLVARREHLKLSQKEAAARIGIPASTLSSYENGSSTSNTVLAKIAVAYDVTADYLLGIDRKTLIVEGLKDFQIEAIEHNINAFKQSNEKD